MNHKTYLLSVLTVASLLTIRNDYTYTPKGKLPDHAPTQLEPREYPSVTREKDMVTPMVANTDIEAEDAEIALEVAKTYEDYEQVFLLQMVIMKIESDFTHLDMNQSGDVGIMQLNNATWEGHRKRLGEDWDPYNKLDNITAGTHEVIQCAKQAHERHPEDWIRWTYIYYNRGKSVEVSNKWKDENFRYTSFVRADKFKHYYDMYRNYFEIF